MGHTVGDGTGQDGGSQVAGLDPLHDAVPAQPAALVCSLPVAVVGGPGFGLAAAVQALHGKMLGPGQGVRLPAQNGVGLNRVAAACAGSPD